MYSSCPMVCVCLGNKSLVENDNKNLQFVCRCAADGCNQKFGTKSNLKKHIERKHQNQQKQYVVRNCL